MCYRDAPFTTDIIIIAIPAPLHGSEVYRILRPMPLPLKLLNGMFDEECVSPSPHSVQLTTVADAAEENSATKNEDEALPVVNSPAALRRRGMSINHSQRRTHRLRVMRAPLPVRTSSRDEGALAGLPADCSFSKSGASVEEGTE